MLSRPCRGLDRERLDRDAGSAATERGTSVATRARHELAGVRGTPSFQIGRTRRAAAPWSRLRSLGPDGIGSLLDAALSAVNERSLRLGVAVARSGRARL